MTCACLTSSGPLAASTVGLEFNPHRARSPRFQIPYVVCGPAGWRVVSLMDRSVSRWPELGLALWAEIDRRPGRFALIVQTRGNEYGASPDVVASLLASLKGCSPYSAGSALSEFHRPPTEAEVAEALSGRPVLTDLEVLFEPELRLNLQRLFQRLARVSGIIALWPGEIKGTGATYSAPGHRDHYEASLHGCLVLRPRMTFFDDQAPFDIERLP